MASIYCTLDAIQLLVPVLFIQFSVFVDKAGIRNAGGEDDRAFADIGAGDGTDILHVSALIRSLRRILINRLDQVTWSCHLE